MMMMMESAAGWTGPKTPATAERPAASASSGRRPERPASAPAGPASTSAAATAAAPAHYASPWPPPAILAFRAASSAATEGDATPSYLAFKSSVLSPALPTSSASACAASS